jgi:hypothetical protein
LARSSLLWTHRLLFTLVATSTVALFAATACAQPMPGGQMQGGPGGGPSNGGPGAGPNNGGPGNGWGNNPGNWNNGGNGWNGGGWRGNGNRRGNGFFPQQFSGSFFTRPYPYHLDYYRMRWGGSYAPYYGNLYGPSNSFYPSQYNGDFGPNYSFGQNGAAQNNSGSNDPNFDPNAGPQATSGPPPTMGDPSYSSGNNAGGEWRWCWIPYFGSPVYGAGPPTFESVGPTYERGPIYHGPFPTFFPNPGDAAPTNALPSGGPLPNSSAEQPNSTTNNSPPTGGNTSTPTLTPAH